MYVSVPSVLVGLGGKCLLDWALVFLQRRHVCKTLLGVFCVSLAIVDSALAICVTLVHINADGYVLLLGSRLTRYHVCLLVQIAGQVYSALQWPVVVSAGLDHFCTVTLRLKSTTARARWLVFSLATAFLWFLAALYVFLLSGFTPVMEDVPHQQIHRCIVLHTSQILQVAMLLLLTLGCAALHAECGARLYKKNLKDQITDQSRAHARRSVVHQAVHVYLNTWALFLVFLAVLFLASAEIPAYLGLNAAWLCFLNSLLTAVVLCVVRPAFQLEQGLLAVPPDSFCEWRFTFSSAAEDKT